MAAKGAFPNLLGGFYALDALTEIFIPGVDEGEAEFPSLRQTWRAVEPIDESDVDSVIEEGGLLEPILVRKRKDGRGEVVEGRQRSRWVRRANERLAKLGLPLIKVKALLQDKNMSEAIAHRKMLAANYHRVDVSPMQRSEDAWHRCTLLGETDVTDVSKSTLEAVAGLMKTSVNTVRNYIALQSLSPLAQEAAAQRSLPLNALVVLASLPEEEQDWQVQELRQRRNAGATSADIVEAARTARDESEHAEAQAEHAERVAEAEAKGQEAPPTPAPQRKPSAKRPKSGEDPEVVGEGGQGLRMAQVRAVLRLAQADRKAGGGAGCSLSDDTMKILRVITGDAKPNFVKGLTELLSRHSKGEK